MKGPLATTITAAASFAPDQLRHPLTLVITADEEIGYGGAKQIAAESKLLAAGLAAIQRRRRADLPPPGLRTQRRHPCHRHGLCTRRAHQHGQRLLRQFRHCALIALQDNDVGTIIGRRSYGKGLVQREMELGDGSAVRLTIARYYTPTGRSIQKPYDHGNESYFNDYMRRYKNGELNNEDSIEVNDSLRYETPEGKIVYGGGGIIPDIFVPKDTDSEKEKLTFLLRGGYMSRFVFDVLEKNRKYYNSITKEDFRKKIVISDAIVNDFDLYIRQLKIGAHPTTEDHKPLLKKYLKAEIAQQLFGKNVFERYLNEDDRIIEKVIELSREK